jgi:hypothetical protein
MGDMSVFDVVGIQFLSIAYVRLRLQLVKFISSLLDDNYFQIIRIFMLVVFFRC